MAFSPDGKLLATADDGYARLWNPATGQPVGQPLPVSPSGSSRFSARAVAFSPDGKLLATAGADGYVRLWNPATGQPAGVGMPADPSSVPLDHAVFGVAFSPDGTVLFSSAENGLVQPWRVSLFVNPYAALCAEVGPPPKVVWTEYAPGEPQQDVCS